MKTFTKDELRELRKQHISLWAWLANTGDDGKYAWPGWTQNGGGISCGDWGCMACVAAGREHAPFVAFPTCSKTCPIPWSGGKTCLNKKSEYNKWCICSRPEKRKGLAAKIATIWPEVE